MNINARSFLLCLIGIAGIFSRALAVTSGNSTTGIPVSPAQVITAGITYGEPSQATPAVIPVPVSLPGQEIIFVIGIVIIVIAIAGLIWRYFHPKYVPPECRKQ